MGNFKKKRFLAHILYERFMDLRIGARIILFYLVLLVFAVAVSGFLYQKVYYGIMLGRVNELSMETLSSIDQSINTMLDNVNIYSKLIITNEDIRNSLKPDSTDAVARIGKNLQSFMETVPVISSVYVFDNYEHYYIMDREQSKRLAGEDIEKAPWYPEVLEKQGGYLLRLNCGGFITDRDNKNFISFIRTFNDVFTQKPLGYLIMNISEDNFANAYQLLMNNYGTSFILLDEKGRNIVEAKDVYGLDMDGVARTVVTGGRSRFTEKIDGREYLISSLRLQKQGWYIISMTPMGEMTGNSRLVHFIALFVFIVNGLLLIAGSIFISRMITNPIKKLLKTMKGIEKGKFEQADVRTGKDEIGELKDGYNLMVTEIQSLIGRVVEEQRVKRMTELNALQAQIKPHFLYNTFDAISYLALSGRSKEVYEVISALANYYRTSLSKGSEIITVSQEVDTVKNYLIIQKVRYGNIFTDSYSVDEAAAQCLIPKLVLQPLVENALYHGIKPKGESGSINISAERKGDSIVLTVEDDGVGMDSEQLNAAVNGSIGSGGAGFGLRGTIERLKIYYNDPDVCHIESRPGYGTRVVIVIRLKEERDGQ